MIIGNQHPRRDNEQKVFGVLASNSTGPHLFAVEHSSRVGPPPVSWFVGDINRTYLTEEQQHYSQCESCSYSADATPHARVRCDMI